MMITMMDNNNNNDAADGEEEEGRRRHQEEEDDDDHVVVSLQPQEEEEEVRRRRRSILFRIQPPDRRFGLLRGGFRSSSLSSSSQMSSLRRQRQQEQQERKDSELLLLTTTRRRRRIASSSLSCASAPALVVLSRSSSSSMTIPRGGDQPPLPLTATDTTDNTTTTNNNTVDSSTSNSMMMMNHATTTDSTTSITSSLSSSTTTTTTTVDLDQQQGHDPPPGVSSSTSTTFTSTTSSSLSSSSLSSSSLSSSSLNIRKERRRRRSRSYNNNNNNNNTSSVLERDDDDDDNDDEYYYYYEPFDRTKLYNHLIRLSSDLLQNNNSEYTTTTTTTTTLPTINITYILDRVICGLYMNVSVEEMISLTAETCASLITQHHHYSILASRILIYQLHKTTPNTFTKAMIMLNENNENENEYENDNDNEEQEEEDVTNQHQPQQQEEEEERSSNNNNNNNNKNNLILMIDESIIDLLHRRGFEIDQQIHHERDYHQQMTYFSYKTLERSFLLKKKKQKQQKTKTKQQKTKTKITTTTKSPTQNNNNNNNNNNNIIVERPQYLFMRVALGIHMLHNNNITTNNTTNTRSNNNNNDNNNNNTNTNEEEEESYRLEAAYETYHYMSRGYFTHASPTLFHSGTTARQRQLASCFLVQMSDDSIEGIYDTLKTCALISKSAGGIGLSVHNIRAKGSPIHGTNGISSGLVPMLRVYDTTSRYVDQGGSKRPGAFAIYIEPWHADIYDILQLKKNHGKEEHRTRDLFFGLWICDLFMKRVQQDEVWSLMCPKICKGLQYVYGTDFEQLYVQYERQGKYVKQVRARDLWISILQTQIETGNPYILYKDHCNAKSNQQNLGTIQCSNLCTEIIQYTQVGPSTKTKTKTTKAKTTKINEEEEEEDDACGGDSGGGEVAVCNLASINLSKFVKQKRLKTTTDDDDDFDDDSRESLSIDNNNQQQEETIYRGSIIEDQDDDDDTTTTTTTTTKRSPRSSKNKIIRYFDHIELSKIVQIVVNNLNNIIDINQYPVQDAKNSNLKHRPIGIGVSGLADTFVLLGIPFTSIAAKQLNQAIFETIYYTALCKSNELAIKYGIYDSFIGSPTSQGILQLDMWNISDHQTPSHIYCNTTSSHENTSSSSSSSTSDSGSCSSSSSSSGSSSHHFPSMIQQQYSNDVIINGGYDWYNLRREIMKTGLRNSLLVAPMPTATTSQILGINECFEPFGSNLYTRRTNAGEFILLNQHLCNDLQKLNLWNSSIRNHLMYDNGSIQNIPQIPKHIKEIYKTVWEMKMKDIIDMSADRGPYIDQSQSLNLFIAKPTIDILNSMHMYSWDKQLKTGMYYLRTKPAAKAIQYTVDKIHHHKQNHTITTTTSSTTNTNTTENHNNDDNSDGKTTTTNTNECNDDDVCLSCQA